MTAADKICLSCQTPLSADAVFCPRCGAATPTEISAGGTAAVAPADQSAEQRRRVQAALGPDYEVQRRIGSGGFAEVWAAFDSRLKRTVAVKILHSELVASKAMLERFRREAQAVAQLRHPGVIPIYAVGEYEGLVYYIMPLVAGESLRERLTREGALAPDEVRRILREATAALAVAHEAGIVHRDIKPENLMLEGKERRLLVMDFGIAKSNAGTQAGLTGTGMIVGTPAYMSPEQAEGSKEVDVRSDIYSLGVVGFELLTGRPPFTAASVPELMLKHMSTPAPLVESLRAGIPDDVAVAINRCLLKQPGERWTDAAELLSFLEGALVLRPAVRSHKLRSLNWRRPATVGAVTGLVALLGLGWFGIGTLRHRTRASGSDDASPAWQNAGFNLGSVVYNVVTTGDSVLAANTMGGSEIFNGREWHRSSEGFSGTVVEGGRELAIRAQRRTFAGPKIAKLFQLFTAAPSLVDSIVGPVEGNPYRVGDDLFWIASGGIPGQSSAGLFRRANGQWVHENLPTTTMLSDVVGIGQRAWFLGYFGSETQTDSILMLDRGVWSLRDVLPGSGRVSGYAAIAFRMSDSSVVLAGSSCPMGAQVGCEPLVVVGRDSGTAWARVPLAGSDSKIKLTLTHAIALNDRDILVSGSVKGNFRERASGPDPCPPSAACVFMMRGTHAEPVEELRGHTLVGVARILAAPHLVTSEGIVWARRAGRWEPVSSAPSGEIRDAEISPVIGGLAVGLSGFALRFGRNSGTVRDNSSDGSTLLERLSFVSVAFGDSSAALVTDSGRILAGPCRVAPAAQLGPGLVRPGGPECHLDTIPGPAGVAVRWAGSDQNGNVLFAGTHGWVASWNGHVFTRLSAPPPAATLDLGPISHLGPTVVVASSRGLAWRRRGDWVWLPFSFTGSFQFGALSDSTTFVAVTSTAPNWGIARIDLDAISSNDLVSSQTHAGKPTAILGLPDASIAVAFVDSSQVPERSWLEVSRRETWKSRKIPLPHATTVWRMVSQGPLLYVFGSRGFAMAIPRDSVRVR